MVTLLSHRVIGATKPSELEDLFKHKADWEIAVKKKKVLNGEKNAICFQMV